MTVSLFQDNARPPYVIFETRSMEDRDASIAKGCRIDREVDWVTIRQVGAKDTVEKEVSVWLETLDKDPYLKPEWVAGYKNAYKAWKEGHEPTPDGTHVSQWPAINKAQASLLIAADIRTVQDLAVANEPALARVGLGARELQQKAQKWLKVAGDTGKAAEELTAMQAKAQAQESRIQSQDVRIAELTKSVEGLTAKLGGVAPTPAPDFM